MSKRLFDLSIALIGIVSLAPFLILGWIAASYDTSSSGVFYQKRIGQYGRPFTIYKLRTIHFRTKKISRLGSWFRATKIDELPQLINILRGQMSFVGPRPDVPGYYDQLQGESRKILELKPGLTSEASLKYADEEVLLAQQADPLGYNDGIIFPDKVRINLDYYYSHSFLGDLKVILRTLVRK